MQHLQVLTLYFVERTAVSLNNKSKIYFSSILILALNGVLFECVLRRLPKLATSATALMLVTSIVEKVATIICLHFLVGPQEPLLATVKRRKLRGSGMSHATTAPPKPSFRASWRVGDAAVDRGNAGWTTSRSGHPCPCHDCSKWLLAEKTERGYLLSRPSCPELN